MGIAVSELLTFDYFRDFRVLAGSRGLGREVQGVTVLDAPDSFRWSRGKEMILSNGYVLLQDPDCVRRAQQEGYLTQMACMVVKAGRYLVPIPPEIIQIFEENDIPLLEAPFSVAYMELMHEVYVSIMNRTTRRFCISAGETYSLGDDSYKERKLRRILQAVEADVRLPACLHDISEGRDFMSSANFMRFAGEHGLATEDFWKPGFPHSQSTLCDTLHMVRYRLREEGGAKDRFSWITVPISFAGAVQAYFVVLESRELIDYYDEYAIRIATLLLQAVYEQLIVARSVGNIGFENLIQFAMNCGESAQDQLITQAGALNFNISAPYLFAVIRQQKDGLNLSSHREALSDELRLGCPGERIYFAFFEPNQCLVMFPGPTGLPQERQEQALRETLESLALRLEKRISGAELRFGYFGRAGTLLEASRNIERCRQALRLGALLYPGRNIWSYEELGPLAWLRMSEDEMEMMGRDCLPLLADPKNAELLRTLKVYLASNMSFSDTAEKMYVHINTIRKRIERVNDLLKINWGDTFTRMKLELLLQLMGV